MSNVKVMVVVRLFPGMVRVETGVSVMFPVASLTDHKLVPRLAPWSVRVLFPLAPLAAFHLN